MSNPVVDDSIAVSGLYYYPEADYGRTILHTAAQWDYIDDVDSILKIIDVNEEDAFGNTPLHLCSSLEVAKKLCNAGANLEARDQEQNTPLHNCRGRDSFEVLQYLVEKGADIEARNMSGETPLLVACRFGDLGYVQMFLYHGANATVVNENGETALEIALEEQYIDIVNELFPYLDDYILQEMNFSERSTLLIGMLRSFDVSSLLYGIFKSDPFNRARNDEDLMTLRESFDSADKIIRKYYYNLDDYGRFLDLLREDGDSQNVYLDWHLEETHVTNVFFNMIFNVALLVDRTGMIRIMYALLSYGALITENDFMVILMADNFTNYEKFEFLSIAICCSTQDLPIFDIPNVISKFMHSKYLLSFASCTAEDILNQMLKFCKLPLRTGVLKCIYHLMKFARITKELEDNYKTYITPIVPISEPALLYHRKNLRLLKTKCVPSLLKISADVVRRQVVQSISKPQGLRALFFAICQLEIPRHLRDTLLYKDTFLS